MQKFTTLLGSLLAIAFLVGLAFTLTRSSMIGFFDVLPVYILMGIAIFMMVYEAFLIKNRYLKIKFIEHKNKPFISTLTFIYSANIYGIKFNCS